MRDAQNLPARCQRVQPDRMGQLMRGEYLRGLLALMVLAMALRLAYDLFVTPADLFSISGRP